MAATNLDVSLHVLLACVNRGDRGFFPRVEADTLDLDRGRLDSALDFLRLGGFIEIADWHPDAGQGYRATDRGRDAAVRPELLRRPAPSRLRDADDSIPGLRSPGWEQAEDIRRSVLSPTQPIVTPALVVINVAVYLGVCAYNLAEGNTVANLINGRMLSPGALVPLQFFLLQDYWQIFTYMFLHGSPIHILMNMFCLFTLGSIMEARWGWARYLILYLGSGLLGGFSVLIWAQNPAIATVGASGAISGLLTSLGVWAWMHRHFLPPQFVEAHFRIVGINLLILAGISFAPNVSMSAHLGGAIGGALLSIPLTWLSPYSPIRHRIIGTVTLLLIAGVCGLVLEMTPRPDLLPRNPMIRVR